MFRNWLLDCVNKLKQGMENAFWKSSLAVIDKSNYFLNRLCLMVWMCSHSRKLAKIYLGKLYLLIFSSKTVWCCNVIIWLFKLTFVCSYPIVFSKKRIFELYITVNHYLKPSYIIPTFLADVPGNTIWYFITVFSNVM